VANFKRSSTPVNTSEKQKHSGKTFVRNKNVDRSVVRRYEELLRDTHGFIREKKGADYRIAPAVGTSRLLIKSLSGKSD
jgi:hypothetical protein